VSALSFLPYTTLFRSETWNFSVIKSFAKRFDISLTAPVEKLSEEQIDMLLFGTDEPVSLTVSYGSYGAREYKVNFEGVSEISNRSEEHTSELQSRENL